MTNEFEIVFEGEFPGTPEQVWDAVTTGTAGWLFPDPESGSSSEEVVTEKPSRHVEREEGKDGWFNQLEQVIEPRGEGRSYLRWVHSGVFVEDWDAQYIAATKHTEFYMHTLAEYLEHFAGKPVVYAEIEGPPESQGPGAFDPVRTALGLEADSDAGASISVDLPGIDAATVVVDYADNFFIGLRTDDALYRFFGRNAFGGPVAITVHHFGAATAEGLTEQWEPWLRGLYAN